MALTKTTMILVMTTNPSSVNCDTTTNYIALFNNNDHGIDKYNNDTDDEDSTNLIAFDTIFTLMG